MMALSKESKSHADYFARNIHLSVNSNGKEELPEEKVLQIHQRSSGTVATAVWDSALVALKYFEKINRGDPSIFCGKKVLELGSGTGVCGLTLSAFGAKVTLTDLENELELIQRNIESNESLFEQMPKCSSLDWSDTASLSKFIDEHFDIILIVDCLYYEASLMPLVEALISLSTKDTQIYCVYEKRDIGKPQVVQEQFFNIAKNHFLIEEIPEEDQDSEYNSPDIPVLRLKKCEQNNIVA